MNDKGNGWESSARAWIDVMGDTGDFGREHVLDGPMLARVRRRSFETALDVGCGEGRFCRMLRDEGLTTVGVEPTRLLREAAQDRDSLGRYIDAIAEKLPFEDASFDLVVSYLSLIDIEGIDEAVHEMVRVLRPGGSLLIANLNSFNTAGEWKHHEGAESFFQIDNYFDERSIALSWGGISIRNWHRPLSKYMKLLLATGLRLVHFDEPKPTGGEPEKVKRYERSPYFNIMEWEKR